ncbi:MAG: AI-2E family transporter, partial [Rhodospirillaceae bacterium]
VEELLQALLHLGLVVGLMAGLLSFIPYVGTIVGFVASMGLAIAQYDDWQSIAAIAGIFVAGQVIEGNYLTPKLVGDRIGLHAVWVIFALMAGGSLFGFLGILLAVPVAAIIGVLARFGLRNYLDGPLYHGRAPDEEADPEPPPAPAPVSAPAQTPTPTPTAVPSLPKADPE